MKVIKVKSCEKDCPYYITVKGIPFNSYCDHVDGQMFLNEEAATIPTWCPLEDES
jgi:hypothetical protein